MGDMTSPELRAALESDARLTINTLGGDKLTINATPDGPDPEHGPKSPVNVSTRPHRRVLTYNNTIVRLDYEDTVDVTDNNDGTFRLKLRTP